MDNMNKTAAFLAFTALAGIMIVGVVLLLLFRPEAVGSLITLVGTVLALVAGFALNLYMTSKQGEKIEQIQKQTNGTLSAKDAEIDRLRAISARNGINPDADEHKDPNDAQAAAQQSARHAAND